MAPLVFLDRQGSLEGLEEVVSLAPRAQRVLVAPPAPRVRRERLVLRERLVQLVLVVPPAPREVPEVVQQVERVERVHRVERGRLEELETVEQLALVVAQEVVQQVERVQLEAVGEVEGEELKFSSWLSLVTQLATRSFTHTMELCGSP